ANPAGLVVAADRRRPPLPAYSTPVGLRQAGAPVASWAAGNDPERAETRWNGGGRWTALRGRCGDGGTWSGRRGGREGADERARGGDRRRGADGADAGGRAGARRRRRG